jgi:hypothetical protein
MNEPVLSRRALLNVLEDRAEITSYYQNRPYTFVCLMTSYNEKEYVGYGFSKVMYPDKWDETAGAVIAKRHALIMVLHHVRADERGKMQMQAWDEMMKEIESKNSSIDKNASVV